MNAVINATYHNERLLPRILVTWHVSRTNLVSEFMDRLFEMSGNNGDPIEVTISNSGNEFNVNYVNTRLDKSTSGDLEIQVIDGKIANLRNNLYKYFAWTGKRLLILGKSAALFRWKGLLFSLCSTSFVRWARKRLAKQT